MTARSDAAAVGGAVALVAPFVLVLGQSVELGSDRGFVLLVAIAALLAAAAAVRRAVGGPGLTGVGVALAATVAWLVPQRPDQASTVLLAALFGVGLGLAHPGARLSAPPHRHPSDATRPEQVVAGWPAGLVGAVTLVLAVGLWWAGSAPVLLALAVVLAAVAGALRPDRRAVRLLRVVAVGVVVVVVAGGYVGYLGGSTVDAAWFGGGVTHGDRDRREVAITFDDGPNPTASLQVAKILDEHGAKGTFFEVGKAIDARPDIVRKLHADGQLLGNHSYTHDSWAWLDPWYPEMAQTDRAFDRAIGRCPTFYRPPHGQRTPFVRRVADDHHERLVLWDVSAQDWVTKDPALIARRILSDVRPGSIILLHDGLDGDVSVDRSVLVRALPLILDGLEAKGLEPVRLDRLIGGPASRPC